MEAVKESKNRHWTTIVITCASNRLRDGVQEECQRLSKGGLLPPHDNLLVVEDPQAHTLGQQEGLTAGVGSGGATINAILVAVERLSAQRHHTTIESEVIGESRVLVVHLGRVMVHSPGGTVMLRVNPALSCVPHQACSTPPTLLQHTIWMTTKLSEETKAGVWVTSLDSFIPSSSCLVAPNTVGIDGAMVVTVEAPLAHAALHGVVLARKGGSISDIKYRMPHEKLNGIFSGGIGKVISGLVFLSVDLTERLLSLHTHPPLDRCTYYGTDSGIPSLQVSLYFDLLLPLCDEVVYDAYVSGECSASYNQASSYTPTSYQESCAARMQIWSQLRGLKATIHHLEGIQHHYLCSNSSFSEIVMPLLPKASVSFGEAVDETCNSGTVIINAYIEGTVESKEGSVIVDSWIGSEVSLKSESPFILIGLQLFDLGCSLSDRLPGGCVWQGYPTEEQYDIITCHGMTDVLAASHHDPSASIFNTKWPDFFTRTAIEGEDLWPDMDDKDQSALTASIFPVDIPVKLQLELISLLVRTVSGLQPQDEWFSRLQEWKNFHRVSLLSAATNCDMNKVVRAQETIYLATVKKFIIDTASDMKGRSLLPLFNYMVTRNGGQVREVVSTLHEILHDTRPSTSRLLANVADVLGCLAADQGGLRSGPAANPQWRNALLHLKNGKQRQAVEMMLEVCQKWMKSGNAEDLIRAARHYERASQIIISQQVETAGKHVWWWQEEKRVGRGVVGMGVWVEAKCPARLDLAGGWSDTPPICYEQGGAVLNVAIKVNRKKPISARVRIIPEMHIACVLRDWCGGEVRLTWTEIDHLRDYDNPVAPGALVKAVLLYCRVVQADTQDTLTSQLQHRYGGGLEVEVWSQLPQGSGLGGSSLVAGSLVAAVVVLLGHPPPSHTTLIHATLCIEQWLTTGGGWQDQVGGLMGGVKLGMSRQGTPVTVSSYKIPLSQAFLATLNAHLILLYTGKVRLARNLLQTVIRNWYARDPTITSCFSQLQQLGVKAAGAVLDEDLKSLGSCIDSYWSLKKMVASGCEPSKVTALMASLRKHCLGMSLAGAGGGGYMYALKTSPEPFASSFQLGGLTCDDVEIDKAGLEVQVGVQQVESVQDEEEVLTKDKWMQLYSEIQNRFDGSMK